LAAVAALAALSACGPGKSNDADSTPPQTSICDTVARAELARALGAEPQGFTDQADVGSPDPGCFWLTQAEGGGQPRTLQLTIWRKKILDARDAPSSGRPLYDDAVEALRRKYARVGALANVGDEAVMAVGESSSAERFSAEILAIKHDDVLSLRIEGRDPAAFEAIARSVARAM
jgi:hypothetical protein